MLYQFYYLCLLIFYFVDSESYLSNYTYLTLGGILIASILFCCIYVKYRILYNIMLEIDYTVSSEFFDLFLINSLSNSNDYLKIEKSQNILL